MWKSESGSREIQKLPYKNLIENFSFRDYSFIRQTYGLTMFIEKELHCVEHWKRRRSSSKKVAQSIAKKLQNYEVLALKKVTELNRQTLMNCP